MAENDEFVNSDVIRSREKEAVADEPIRQPIQCTNNFPDSTVLHQSSDDDDDIETDPIMNLISNQKTPCRSDASNAKDPNRFIKALEARAASSIRPNEINASSLQINLNTVESQASSAGILQKFDWIKTNVFPSSQLKIQQIVSRIAAPQAASCNDQEIAKHLTSTRDGEASEKERPNNNQPIVSSSSVLRPEESMELQRLQAAARTSDGAILFLYLLQDKLLQHKLVLLLGIALIFFYIMKGTIYG
jgi:hypothetical protein